MEEERRIILNRIKTPDGTILISRHRYDFVTYIDANGLEYMVDGGTDYLRRNVNMEAPYEEMSIYSDAPFEEVREHYCRGGRGKDGTESLKWVPLAKMSNDWLEACIVYNEERGLKDSFASSMYAKELKYREENDIFIKD